MCENELVSFSFHLAIWKSTCILYLAALELELLSLCLDQIMVKVIAKSWITIYIDWTKERDGEVA